MDELTVIFHPQHLLLSFVHRHRSNRRDYNKKITRVGTTRKRFEADRLSLCTPRHSCGDRRPTPPEINTRSRRNGTERRGKIVAKKAFNVLGAIREQQKKKNEKKLASSKIQDQTTQIERRLGVLRVCP